MVETRASRGGRGGRSPHGRGRRGGRTTPVESETRVSASDGVGVGDGAPAQGDAVVRVEGPVQPPLPVGSDRLQEIVRRLVREAVVAARAALVLDPVAPPVSAPSAAQVPAAGARSESYVDWVPVVGECRPLLFHGGHDSDVELWLRGIEGIFDMVAAPDDVRCRLAIGLLREDALSSWMIRQGERPAWTYADFKGAMLRDFSPPGVQMSREATFLRGAYTRSTPIPEVIHQFQRELFYCSHLCPTDASRIWILLRRLSPEVLLHTSGLGDVSFDQFLEVVLSYDQQGILAAPSYPSSSSRPRGKRPRAVICYGCHEEGHIHRECPREPMECHFCYGHGHRASHCPRMGGSRARGGRAVALPHPPRVLSLRGVEDDHPATPFTGMVCMRE